MTNFISLDDDVLRLIAAELDLAQRVSGFGLVNKRLHSLSLDSPIALFVVGPLGPFKLSWTAFLESIEKIDRDDKLSDAEKEHRLVAAARALFASSSLASPAVRGLHFARLPFCLLETVFQVFPNISHLRIDLLSPRAWMEAPEADFKGPAIALENLPRALRSVKLVLGFNRVPFPFAALTSIDLSITNTEMKRSRSMALSDEALDQVLTPNLTSLKLHFFDTLLPKLSAYHNENLRRLELQSPFLESVFPNLSYLPNLEELSISGFRGYQLKLKSVGISFGALPAEVGPGFENLSNLRVLELGNCSGLSLSSFKSLAKLEVLSVDFIFEIDKPAAEFSRIAELKHLRDLRIYGKLGENLGLLLTLSPILGNLERFKLIREVSSWSPPFDPSPLLKLLSPSKLKSMALSSMSITENTTKEIGIFTKLTSLFLHPVKKTPVGNDWLLNLATLTALESLTLTTDYGATDAVPPSRITTSGMVSFLQNKPLLCYAIIQLPWIESEFDVDAVKKAVFLPSKQLITLGYKKI